MRMILRGWVIALSVLGGGSAFAGGAAYSPDDIIKFFSKPEATRGVCVGSEEDCGFAEKKPASFNLMVTFAKDSANLTGVAKQNLDSFAEALKSPSLSVAKFSIEGYTDATGTVPYNASLSQRRAASVVAYLADKGIDAAKLRAEGLGEANPLNGNVYDPANRRVETRLVLE